MVLYLNETFHFVHLVRCLFGTLGIYYDKLVQNRIDSDCISFRLENLIDLLLRSAHLYQDGGQVSAVLRVALTAVENCRQSEDDPTIWGNLLCDALFANCPFLQIALFCDAFLRVVSMPLCVLPFCVLALCIMPFCVLALCVMPFCMLLFCMLALCVMPLCIMPFCVLALYVMPFCVLPLCVMPLCMLPFSVMPFTVMPFSV